MKEFMNESFLINNETGLKLYNEFAKDMPIFDYHCHLPIKEIYENRHYENITKLWLVDGTYGDHYKWRAMRSNGVSEKYITGDASDFEKFEKWVETVPYTFANPLYHWTHMELKKYFNVNEPINSLDARKLYDKMNDFLKTHGAREIITMSNVDTICTTDDPLDDLEYHKLLKEDKSFKTKVYPAFRPDKVVNIYLDSFNEYIKKLSEVVNFKIDSLDSLEKALKERIDYFDSVGCFLSDHGLDKVYYLDSTKEETDLIFKKKLNGTSLSFDEVRKYSTYIMIFFGREYKRHNWVQQYHVKAQRNNNSRMMSLLGPDTGFDSISDSSISSALSSLLDKLDSTNELPKTILYSLDPNDYEVLASLGIAFYEDGVAAKMQLGSAWWFNDQKDGIDKQIRALSSLGLLSRFVGMLTDSRSFLSYTRHDYFRRILCSFVGEVIEKGEYPLDYDFVGNMIKDICFRNAKEYFKR